MRHPIRSAVIAGTSALLLAAGAGTASAQGSLEFTLPFPLDIPGLASLAPTAGAPDGQTEENPTPAIPADLSATAFEGGVVAGMNEARTAVGAERLITDPDLAATASERAEQLAVGDTATGDLSVPDPTATHDRTTLALAPGSTPQNVLTELLSDTGMRERMLEGEFTQVGVGVATAADGTMHVVLDFARG